MAVRAKRVIKSEVAPSPVTMVAADVLKTDHPVHAHFVQWLGDKVATKRQARKFMQAFPKYSEVTPCQTNC